MSVRHSFLSRFFLFMVLLVGSVSSFEPLYSQPLTKATKKKGTVPKVIQQKKIKENKKLSWVVLDARTGEIILEYKCRETRYPASLTKMMTVYLTLEKVRDKKLKLTDALFVSEKAARQQPGKLFLKAGTKILLKDAILGTMVKSANDATSVLAEKIAQTEAAFARLMTQKAKALGLQKTHFRNASGLPNKSQVTCALDMAKLGQALMRDFPEFCSYFSVKQFTYRGTTHKNTNKLLGKVPGVDGIKTGYTPQSGFNLAVSATRGSTRLIAVVMGTRSPADRTQKATAILEEGFHIMASRPSKRSLHPPSSSPKSPPQKPSRTNKSVDELIDHNKQTQELVDIHPLEPFSREEISAPHTTLDPIAELDKELVFLLGPPTPTVTSPSHPASPPSLAPAQVSKAQPPFPKSPPFKPTIRKPEGSWSVQVGTFGQENLCHQELSSLKKKFPKLLQTATPKVLGPISSARRKKCFLARFVNLEKEEAHRICQKLSQTSRACVVVAPCPPESNLPKKPPQKPSKNKKKKFKKKSPTHNSKTA